MDNLKIDRASKKQATKYRDGHWLAGQTKCSRPCPPFVQNRHRKCCKKKDKSSSTETHD